VVELLPPAAAEKLRLLRQRREDRHRLVPEFEQIREASMARVAAEHALKRLVSHPQDGGFNLGPDDRRVIEAQRTLDKATDEFKHLQELQEVRSEAFQAASGALVTVEDFLRHGMPGNCQIAAEIEVEPPKLLKGEGPLDGAARFQRRGREIKAAIHTIRSSCFPKSYCRQRMREQVEPLVRRGEVSVSRLVEIDGEIEWPMQRVRSELYGEQRQAAFGEVPDAVALVAWMFKDALIAALDREIDAEADDAASLSHEERQRREAEAQGDLLAVERDECALVWQAQAQGLPCEFRADCSPLAILGLRLITVPRATELPPSSAERAGFNLIGGRR